MQRRRMVRLQPVALIEAGNRLLGAPELQQHGGALHGGIPILRREPLELAQGKQRFVEPLALDEKAGEIAPGLRRRGIELHRLVERSQRLVVSSLAAQQVAEARQILRLCILPNGAGQPFQREVKLGGLRRQKSEQMHRVGMMWIDRERLLAAKLGIERPGGLEMAEARRAERCGIIGTAGCRGGCSGRSLTFVRGHEAHSSRRRRENI